jgi:cardiolipin synthase
MQIVLLFYIAWQIGQYGIYIYITFNILSVIVAFAILNRSFNPAYKISWLLVVLIIPFAGVSFYLLFGRLRLSKNRIRKINELYNDLALELKKNYHDVLVENDDLKK